MTVITPPLIATGSLTYLKVGGDLKLPYRFRGVGLMAQLQLLGLPDFLQILPRWCDTEQVKKAIKRFA